MIRHVQLADAQSIADIYNHYVESTVVSFETESVSSEEIASRIAKITSRYPYWVYEEHGKLLGYAYISEFRSRIAYRHTGETTIYLHPDCVGKGIGKRLYCTLIDDAREHGLHLLVGGITLPNPASVGLHERFGFQKAAHFHEVGRKFDQWLDVGFWELIL